MASVKAFLQDTLSKLAFKELTVEEVREVTPHFRRLRISADWLRTTSVAAGDKLQIMIADAGPRTYTPFERDAQAGSCELLAYVHGDTPGAAWIKAARAGLKFRAFGPRGSLPLSRLHGPIVFFGDETSFAAAASLQRAHPQRDELAFVFECTHAQESEQVLRELGIEPHAIVPRQHPRDHMAALEGALRSALSLRSPAQLVLTGHAQTIQALRARLKTSPCACAGQKVKAYWADGKRGLD